MLLLIIISILFVTAVIRWRINMALQRAKERRLANTNRRPGFPWSLFAANPLRKLKDPREAATAMMIAVAEADGQISVGEYAEILRLVSDHFGTSRETAEAFVKDLRKREVTRDGLDYVLRSLAPLMKKSLDKTEKRELLHMLRRVAQVDAAGNEIIALGLKKLEQRLL